MKICFLNNLYKPYNHGGAEKVVEAMMKTQQKAGNEVFLITTKPKAPDLGVNTDYKTFYITSNFYNLGEKWIIFRLFWHINNLLFFKKYRVIREILKKENPDLIITHNLMGLGMETMRAIRKTSILHHHFLHDIQLLHPSGLMMFGQEKKVNSSVAKIYQAITRFIISSPYLVISPSRWLLDEHLKRNFFSKSKYKIQTLDEIFSNLKSASIKRVPKNQAASNKLLFVGQIEKHKGILFLIKAFMKKATPEMSLTIAGDGSLISEIKKISQNDKRLKILGRVTTEKVKSLMLEADKLIMPSLCYENYPTVIVEAKACGLEVIASNIGGIPEMISDKHKLFQPGDGDDLFKKINT